jgi:hypothetical protein
MTDLTHSPWTPPPVRASIEGVEDAAFESLIRRWTTARDWGKVQAAFVVYGTILDERELEDEA